MDGRRIKNMEEFAALSGISRPTVSKYFNDPTSVRQATRKRIEAALEQYDYRPNIFAVNQNRRNTKNIGIVVPYLADPFFAEIARNIEQRCIEAGYFPILFSSHGEKELETDVLDTLRSLKPAGVLLAPLGRRSDRGAVERFCHDVPTILFDSEMDALGEAFVGSNNPQSVGLMVEYLCRTGEPPSFLEMKAPTNPNARKRHAAYVAAMERFGHAPMLVRVPGAGWDFERIGYEAGMRQLAGAGFPTDTVLCSNDRLAIGLLAAAFESGRRVGHQDGSDFRIAGHDDHPFARYTSPSLTTVSQDYAAIAERSLSLIFETIEAGGTLDQRRTILFEGKLVMRMSA
ncbi:MAG: LacI family DNA-binding transcriptional regulator [Pseudomonadota bacterium]